MVVRGLCAPHLPQSYLSKSKQREQVPPLDVISAPNSAVISMTNETVRDEFGMQNIVSVFALDLVLSCLSGFMLLTLFLSAGFIIYLIIRSMCTSFATFADFLAKQKAKARHQQRPTLLAPVYLYERTRHRTRSDRNPFDLIERDLIAGAVVELGGTGPLCAAPPTIIPIEIQAA